MMTLNSARRAGSICGISLVIGLTGCGSMKPLPSDTFYRLKIERGVSEKAKGVMWTEKLLRVTKFHASGLHRERPIVYSDADQVVVKQHRYHLWIDSPERMLQHDLISYLRAARVAPGISGADLSGEGIEIQGRIRQMDQVIAADSTRVVVALAFDLIERGSDPTLVFGREYRESRMVSGGDMRAVAAAMSDAVGAIFERFAFDAGGALAGISHQSDAR